MNDFRAFPAVAAGGFTLATLGPQLALAAPVLIPVALGAVVLGLLLRAVIGDEEKAEAKAAEADSAETARQARIDAALRASEASRRAWAKEEAEAEALRQRLAAVHARTAA
jgi:hypothetical protein